MPSRSATAAVANSGDRPATSHELEIHCRHLWVCEGKRAAKDEQCVNRQLGGNLELARGYFTSAIQEQFQDRTVLFCGVMAPCVDYDSDPGSMRLVPVS